MDRVKRSYLLRITEILVTCEECRCIKLVVTIITPQKTPESDARCESYARKTKVTLTGLFLNNNTR